MGAVASPRMSQPQTVRRQLRLPLPAAGAVIEVNELQKRRVVAKLHKHLRTLVGKRVALLGLAFRRTRTTCGRRPRSCSRHGSNAAEGAPSCGYDPVAEDQAREHLPRPAATRAPRRRRSRRPTRSSSSPSGRVHGPGLGRARADDARDARRRWPQRARCRGGARRGLVDQGIGGDEEGLDMQAVILVGGEGTRLRPLTSRCQSRSSRSSSGRSSRTCSSGCVATGSRTW